MNRKLVLAGLVLGLLSPLTLAAQTVEVYKSPTCGCCAKWAEHVRDAGFDVRVIDTSDVPAVRARSGIPSQFGSCHTARVGGYTIEGHVPAVEIKRLLAERPQAIGLAVPAMPIGSPGMPASAAKPEQPYEVFLVKADGTATTFAKYGPR